MPITTSQLVKYTLYGTMDVGADVGRSSFFNAVPSLLGAGNGATPVSYTFRAEDIVVDRVPTVRRIVITYVNLGACTLTFTLTGTNDLGATVTATTTVTIGSGTFGLTFGGPILTAFIDLELTAFRPQLTISRAISAGGFYISSVMLVGTVEDQTL